MYKAAVQTHTYESTQCMQITCTDPNARMHTHTCNLW